jgi:5-methylcytosine-specific restriction endonuclease McrA
MVRCKEKYNAYMRVAILKRYNERRDHARVALGGKCIKCGALENLEFDHIDSKEKSFSIGTMWSVSKARYEAELAKCQLLCSGCHMEKTILDRGQVPTKDSDVHGTLSSYRYCHCELCKKAKSAYVREYRSRKAAQT